MEMCNNLLILENNTEWYESAVKYAEKLGEPLCILVVLEDIYMLEKTSSSFGLPSSPDLVPKAKDKINRKLDVIIEKNNIKLKIKEITVDKIDSAVSKFIREWNPKTVILGLSDVYRSIKIAEGIEKNVLIIKLRGG